jgi:hypothetical protein
MYCRAAGVLKANLLFPKLIDASKAKDNKQA